MQRQTRTNFYPYQFGEAALVASRKIWLAGLGATVVTRDWMQSEADHVFRTLVKQGTVVESRAIQFVGDRVESSFTRANSMWKQTRRTVEAKVKKAATSVVDYAQQVVPRSLPTIALAKKFAIAEKPAMPAKRARKTVKARATRTVKKAKRATKRA